MERYTVTVEGGYSLNDRVEPEEVINRLARYEDAHQELLARQARLEDDLEKLRKSGKQSSGKFKELVVRKLMNQSYLDMLP